MEADRQCSHQPQQHYSQGDLPAQPLQHDSQDQVQQQLEQQQDHQSHAAIQQQQEQQQQQADLTQLPQPPAQLQQSASAADDYLDCEELYSSGGGSEGSELDSGSDQGCSSAGDDQLPLMSPAWTPDHTFKVLLVGDSGVGKTCLVMRFIADKFETQLPSTVGVDFAIKRMVVGDNNIKLTIWDTAGQERFRALTSTFYRGAVGIIFVYDVTRRETLSSLSGSWMQELQMYDPHPEVARMVVANKVDQREHREVTWEEGADFAKQHGCLFVETSAKHNIAVGVAFEELVLRILDTPALLAAVAAEEQKGGALNLAATQPASSGMAISCSC